jgi:peptidoglycan/LPS O-acetylase OafA/YrhL
MSPTGRNGSLDLLRCLAIVLVVNCHTVSAYGASRGLSALQLGGKGVDLFFVLSGWLLGHQLLSELRNTGQIEMRRFWVRRWLRTLPAYYAVLSLTFAWQLAVRNNTDLCWSYLVFGQTYLTDMPYFGVSWSLCVEEHFYLAVAPLLLFASRYSWWWMLPVFLVPSLCRSLGWYETLDQTHVRYDQCAVGVLLAYLAVFVPAVWQRACRLAPVGAALGLAAVGWAVLGRLEPTLDIGDYGPLVWALIAGSFVLLAVSRLFWQQLRLPGARYLADRAYAIYLLHGEALALAKRTSSLPFVLYLLITWVVSLVLAELLYRLVERPIMRAREWFVFSCSREHLAAGSREHLAVGNPDLAAGRGSMVTA